ncbi:hypothetical protein RyT2_14530 [Pseudolactococcus yaeyamensis]
MEMVMPMKYVEMTDDEMMYVDGGGYVGFNIHVSAATGRRGAAACGVIAAAAVEAGIAAFATTFGQGVGMFLSLAFSGMVGIVVADAVASGKFYIPIGTNIWGISWVRNITI